MGRFSIRFRCPLYSSHYTVIYILYCALPPACTAGVVFSYRQKHTRICLSLTPCLSTSSFLQVSPFLSESVFLCHLHLLVRHTPPLAHSDEAITVCPHKVHRLNSAQAGLHKLHSSIVLIQTLALCLAFCHLRLFVPQHLAIFLICAYVCSLPFLCL